MYIVPPLRCPIRCWMVLERCDRPTTIYIHIKRRAEHEFARGLRFCLNISLINCEPAIARRQVLISNFHICSLIRDLSGTETVEGNRYGAGEGYKGDPADAYAITAAGM